MPQTFEEVFLAVAVKNKLMSAEDARAAFQEFSRHQGKKPIGEIVVEQGKLSADQVKLIRNAVIKMFMPKSSAPPTPTAGKSTVRVAAKPDPQEPIPGFLITNKLGVGGTATVFLAKAKKFGGKEVALKILLPQRAMDPKFVERFDREARMMIQFKHPNIVRGYDYGKVQYEGMPPLYFLALEYMRGESIQDIIEREGRLSEGRAIEILLEAAKAVQYLAKNRLIHRDIKPDNLMINASGEIKLLDLGFAIPMGEEGARMEEEGTTSGTVQYMSPEQAQGMKDLDVRTDIYSLGATLYHMVIGEVPFGGDDSLEVMAKQVLEALNSDKVKNRAISKHMHYFIERMMSKDKDFRYGDTAELIADVRKQAPGDESP